jgi:glycosyltransferase involved in cell wall biosynthesis
MSVAEEVQTTASTHSSESRRVSILVISSDTFPATRVDVAVLFAEELASRGHHVDFVLQSEGECRRAFMAPWGNGVVWVGPTDLGGSLLNRIRKHVLGIAHDVKMLWLLRGGDYDIVQVKDKFLSGVLAIVAARVCRRPFVYWLSYPFPEAYLHAAVDGTARYPMLSWVRGAIFSFLLYRVLLRAADHVFVQSDQMQRDVAGHGVPIEKLTPVPMGVKLDYVAHESVPRKRTFIPVSERCFLYLGELSRTRRLDFLIRVLGKVRERIPDAKLYLVGPGEAVDRQLLVAEATRLGLMDAVVFVGQLPRDKAFEYVRDANVCVSPIFPNPVFNPASPTKLIEYMALGKAVVANDHPDQRFVIEQSRGGICVPWDEQAFADALIALLPAAELADAMGERGKRWVALNRAYPIIADNVEREYLRIAMAASRSASDGSRPRRFARNKLKGSGVGK